MLKTLSSKELEVQDEDGTGFLMRILLYRTSQNLIDGLVMTFVDVDRVKLAQRRLTRANVVLEAGRARVEDALRHSEDRYEMLVDLSPFLIMLLSGETITFINQAGVRMLGASRSSEIVGQLLGMFIDPGDRDRIAQVIRHDVMQDGRVSSERVTLQRTDGTKVAATIAAAPFMGAGKMAIQVIAQVIVGDPAAELHREGS